MNDSLWSAVVGAAVVVGLPAAIFLPYVALAYLGRFRLVRWAYFGLVAYGSWVVLVALGGWVRGLLGEG